MISSKRGFTLIEMMISITILSIMMLFLYKTYSTFNISNDNLKKELDTTLKIQKIKKTIYLDFTLAQNSSIRIQNREKNEDFIFFQTTNSIHRRYNPYIAYKVKNNKLYRLESLNRLTTYEFPADSEFDADFLGEVKSFRVYKSSKKDESTYVIHIVFKKFNEVLFKVKVLN